MKQDRIAPTHSDATQRRSSAAAGHDSHDPLEGAHAPGSLADRLHGSPRSVAQRKLVGIGPAYALQRPPLQRYLNPLTVDDLVGEAALQSQLRPLMQVYNAEEDKVPEDFSGYKRYSSSYIDAQIQRLAVLEGHVDTWISTHPGDGNAYIRDLLVEQVKRNISRDRRELEGNRVGADIEIQQGLIHGTYKWLDNSVDLHVSSKGEGPGFSTADMTLAAQKAFQKMTQRREDGGPVGKFILHPTGAAVVKIMVQLLGEALGDPALIELAHNSIKWRKLREKMRVFKQKPMSADMLDTSVHAEHFAYLRSLAGAAGLTIAPILKGTKSEAEFNQNMLEQTALGAARLKAYADAVEKQEYGVSLNIQISADRLLDMLRLLEG